MVPVSKAGMKNWLRSVRVLSNARRPADRTNTIHYIDPYVTLMDQICSSVLSASLLSMVRIQDGHQPREFQNVKYAFRTDVSCLISRVSDQNGISRLYVIVEIYHYGRTPLLASNMLKRNYTCTIK